MSLVMLVGHPADTQVVDMTRLTEMVQGEVTEMMVIVIAMGAARESTARIGTGTVTEKVGVTDEAKAENDTESLRPGRTINPICCRGGAVEGEKLDPMCYRHLLHPHHRCMARMSGEELCPAMSLELHRGRVEAAMEGATMIETVQGVVEEVEVEITTWL